MTELDDLEALARADRLHLQARAADLSLIQRAAADAIGFLDSNAPARLEPIHLDVVDDLKPLASIVAGLQTRQPPHMHSIDVTALELRPHLSFDDHPAYVFTYLLSAAARLSGAAPTVPVIDEEWLHSLTPAVAGARNPAKQIALRFFNRVPLLWADGGWAVDIARDWRLRILRYAESAALASSFADMQQGWSMARFPNFWAQALISVRLIGATATVEADALQLLLSKRRIQTTEIATPGANHVEHAVHLLYLGEWVALYLAALYGVDPSDRVPLQLLGIA